MSKTKINDLQLQIRPLFITVEIENFSRNENFNSIDTVFKKSEIY